MIFVVLGIGWLAFAVMIILFFKKSEQLKSAQSKLEEQKTFFDLTKSQLEQSFKVLASETLQTQSESFLRLAEERLDKKTVEAKGSFNEKVIEITKILNPVKESIQKLELGIDKVEKNRHEQFGRISEQLIIVAQTSEKLKQEASSLTKALRRPEVRGSWGEIQLRRVVELAGMSSYCDFEEQVVVRDQNKNIQKPDLIVKLPNGSCVIVDSKAVLDAFLEAVEAENPTTKQQALERHSRNLRSRVSDLSKKSYWEQFEGSAEFAVLFIPNEALLAAAVENDKLLIEDALKEKVVIATPTTLVALLKAIYYGWQQNQVTENAQSVIRTAKEFYDRLTPWLKHLTKVGTALESAVKSYNDSMGSLESRVLPTARKLKELGLSDREDLPDLPQPDVRAKEITKGEAEDVASLT